MSASFNLVSGDTGSKIRVTCKNDSDESIIDLTSKTVNLKWKNAAGVLQTKQMTIINPATDGKAEYQFVTTEIYPDKMKLEVEIIDSISNKIRSLDLISLKVRTAL